mmetsp:Transcript_37575/g.95434  ORF Transcript_37575/g.95434 Transcript_37575/m.95434 type:complete len:236 (-) Transcript_37575:490-1197(-)
MSTKTASPTSSRSATGARTSCTSARSKTTCLLMAWWITQARPSATRPTRRPRSRWTWRTSTATAISTSSWATSAPRTWSTCKTARRTIPHRRPPAPSPRQPRLATIPTRRRPRSWRPTWTRTVRWTLSWPTATRRTRSTLPMTQPAESWTMIAYPMRPLAPSRCPTTTGRTASSAPSGRRTSSPRRTSPSPTSTATVCSTSSPRRRARPTSCTSARKIPMVLLQNPLRGPATSRV